MRKIFAVAALIFSSQLFAQVPDSVIVIMDDFPRFSPSLDKVVITTNKFPTKQSNTGKVTTIIDRNTIEQMGARTLPEILNTVAGTTINGANNNLGTNQRISIRGSSDGNVLLLIDGIPVNDPSVISNYYDLNFINTNQIERIEILKGGQSTLYGSDAVSGVINIITRKPSTNKPSPYAAVSYGSYSTLNASAGLKGKTKRLLYNAFASGTHSEGFSSAYDSTHNKGFDRDGFKQYILHGDLGINLSKKFRLDLLANYSRYKADIDAAAFTDDKDFSTTNRNTQLGAGLFWKLASGGVHFNYQYNDIERSYLDDSADRASFSYFSKSKYLGKTHYAEAYLNYKWETINFLFGADYRFYKSNQEYHSISMYGPFDTELPDSLARIWQYSPYASIVYNQHNLTIDLGGRWNHHSVYGDNFTYSFNPSYLVKDKLKLFANLSSAFKTPTLYQLFDPYSGNKELSPEKTQVFEGGVELYPTRTTRLRVTDFYRKTKNAIQYIITDPNFFSGQYRNVNNQKNYGVEVELNLEQPKWSLAANYTFTRGKISSNYSESGDQLAKDTSYNNLYRVPKHAANLFLTYRYNKNISFSTLLRYVGSRFEPVYAAAPVQLDDYFTIDLSAQYRFYKSMRAFVDLKNLTNKRYFDILGYNSRRFNWSAGVQLSFD